MFPLHLLLMNAMLGFAVLSLYSLLKGGKTDRRLAHELAKALPVLIAFAVNFGVAALLFLQVLLGQFFYTSSVLMAVFWLCVPAFLIVAYYAAYIYDFRFDSLGKAGAVPIALASALFFAIAFLFTSNTTLMIEPLRWSGYFSDPGRDPAGRGKRRHVGALPPFRDQRAGGGGAVRGRLRAVEGEAAIPRWGSARSRSACTRSRC